MTSSLAIRSPSTRALTPSQWSLGNNPTARHTRVMFSIGIQLMRKSRPRNRGYSFASLCIWPRRCQAACTCVWSVKCGGVPHFVLPFSANARSRAPHNARDPAPLHQPPRTIVASSSGRLTVTLMGRRSISSSIFSFFCILRRPPSVLTAPGYRVPVCTKSSGDQTPPATSAAVEAGTGRAELGLRRPRANISRPRAPQMSYCG